jgi:hypothetical protein
MGLYDLRGVVWPCRTAGWLPDPHVPNEAMPSKEAMQLRKRESALAFSSHLYKLPWNVGRVQAKGDGWSERMVINKSAAPACSSC